ncbi:MAG: hypothetical protein QMD71_04165 [bacterium]|nr:hypothetical protein [bacterium]
MMFDRTQIECGIRTHLLKGEYERAISIYSEIDLQNGEPDIHELIGNAYVMIEELENAIQEYLCSAALYADEGLFENGIAAYRKILRISPYNETVYFNLAWLYAKLGLLKEAMDCLITYLRLSGTKNDLRKESQKYKNIMDLIASDESLKPRLNEVLGFNTGGFAQYVDGYNEVKALLTKGYSIEEIKEATGFDEELIKKYQEIANIYIINE